MIHEQYGMGGEGFSGSGSFGEDSGEPGTIWVRRPSMKDVAQLHAKGPFNAHRPLMYHSQMEASRVARKVKGYVSASDGKYYIYKTSSLKEEYGAGEDASTEASMKYKKDTPGQDQAEMPYHKTVKTIKKFMKDKYRKTI